MTQEKREHDESPLCITCDDRGVVADLAEPIRYMLDGRPYRRRPTRPCPHCNPTSCTRP